MIKIKVAFQGEKGAYSHIACEEIFKDIEIKNCATFEEVFKVTFEDESIKAIIPLENSLAGRVADIHHLLIKYKLQIYAEHFQTVEHCLLCKKDVELKDVKYVRSHAQAIGQCQEIIKKK
jgi:prephenate dehydratase